MLPSSPAGPCWDPALSFSLIWRRPMGRDKWWLLHGTAQLCPTKSGSPIPRTILGLESLFAALVLAKERSES